DRCGPERGHPAQPDQDRPAVGDYLTQGPRAVYCYRRRLFAERNQFLFLHSEANFAFCRTKPISITVYLRRAASACATSLTSISCIPQRLRCCAVRALTVFQMSNNPADTSLPAGAAAAGLRASASAPNRDGARGRPRQE